MRTIDKVTCYVTRVNAGRVELLVFEPPGVGLQVPAGTVEVGEAFAGAAIREAHEETGLSDVRLAACLGAIEVRLVDASRCPIEPVSLYADAARRDFTGRTRARAHWLRVLDRSDASALVSAAGDVGWIDATSLATHMRRVFFQAVPNGEVPTRWEVREPGHPPHECYWAPLDPTPAVHHEPEWFDALFRLALLESA